MQKFGHRKGALSFVFDEALDLWLNQEKNKNLQFYIDNILEKLRNFLPFLRKTYKVRTIGIFGSYTRYEATIDSDADLLVDFEQTPSLIKFIELHDFLSIKLKLKVDLVDKATLKPELRQSISKEKLCA